MTRENLRYIVFVLEDVDRECCIRTQDLERCYIEISENAEYLWGESLYPQEPTFARSRETIALGLESRLYSRKVFRANPL